MYINKKHIYQSSFYENNSYNTIVPKNSNHVLMNHELTVPYIINKS